jgi:hypothetical protein
MAKKKEQGFRITWGGSSGGSPQPSNQGSQERRKSQTARNRLVVRGKASGEKPVRANPPIGKRRRRGRRI